MHPALVFAAACAGGALWLHRRAQRLDDWRDLAHKLGLRFRDLGNEGLELEMDGLDRPLHIDRQPGATRLWTTYSIAGGPRFLSVAKRKVDSLDLDSVERRFGPATWLKASKRFDRDYWTFTHERARAAALLASSKLSIADTLLDELPGMALQSCRRVIELTIPDPQPSKHAAHAALIALAEMAGSDVFGLEALLSLPGAQLAPDPDRNTAQVVEVAGSAPVIFRPTEGSFAVITEASAMAPPGQPFTARIDDGGGVQGALPPASIPLSAVIELPRLGSGELVRDKERVSFRWAGVVTDRDVLLAGTRFLAAFAAGGGP